MDGRPSGEVSSPIAGQVMLLTAAKASVGPSRLPDLLRAVQADLAPRLDAYRRRYELALDLDADDDGGDGALAAFFVPDDHWQEVCERLGFDRRETEAVARAHAEQLLRLGSRHDRREEFETALDLRAAVVVGTPDGS